MADNKVEERVKAVIEEAEQGIENVFHESRYRDYLEVLGRFPSYSINNAMLIALHSPQATQVASFDSWKNSYKRYVQKGERGFPIIRPKTVIKKEKVARINPDTNDFTLDGTGNIVLTEVEVNETVFDVVKNFDIAQTKGEELEKQSERLKRRIGRDNSFRKIIEEISPVPIVFEDFPLADNGLYNHRDRHILIQNGLNEIQRVEAIMHELPYAILHAEEIQIKEETLEQRKDSKTKKIEAESIAYVVGKTYGLEMPSCDFTDVAEWKMGKDLAELKRMFGTIKHTSAKIIKSIDEKMKEIQKDKAIKEPTKESGAKEKKEPNISFYVAECGESYASGEYHENLTLQEAVAVYETIPSERMNGIKEIGFHLETGLEGVFEQARSVLFYANSIDMDAVVSAEWLRDNPLVKEAMQELAESFPEARILNRETISQLTEDIAKFAQEFDLHEYRNAVEGKENATEELEESLVNQDINHITEAFQEMLEKELEAPEDIKEVKSILRRIDDLYLKREMNPLVKVEEIEEQNYNQIDGILNNKSQEKNLPSGSVHERLEVAKGIVAQRSESNQAQTNMRGREELGD